MQNPYFQALPDATRMELGRAAFETYLNYEPSFAWTGTWDNLTPQMKLRWMAIVESVMNALQGLEEHVTTHMELFNQAHRVFDEAVQRFEAINPADTDHNNYQLLEWLRSANAEILNARLLMNRADIATGNIGDIGEDTARVVLPNVRIAE